MTTTNGIKYYGLKEIQAIVQAYNANPRSVMVKTLHGIFAALDKQQKGVFLQGYRTMKKDKLVAILRKWVIVQQHAKTKRQKGAEWERVSYSNGMQSVLIPGEDKPWTLYLNFKGKGAKKKAQSVVKDIRMFNFADWAMVRQDRENGGWEVKVWLPTKELMEVRYVAAHQIGMEIEYMVSDRVSAA